MPQGLLQHIQRHAGGNATLHAGINARTPLEAMNYLVRGKASMITWLPEAKRRTLCLMQMAHRCRVRGYLAQGTRPHINLFQVRYTSAATRNRMPAATRPSAPG